MVSEAERATAQPWSVVSVTVPAGAARGL